MPRTAFTSISVSTYAGLFPIFRLFFVSFARWWPPSEQGLSPLISFVLKVWSKNQQHLYQLVDRISDVESQAQP